MAVFSSLSFIVGSFEYYIVRVIRCCFVCFFIGGVFSQEVFYLTYTPDDVEGNIHLDTGDKVSFYMETNKQ